MNSFEKEKDTHLYYMPGTCALGVHIALEWCGAPYSVEEVKFEDLRSPEYLAKNPSAVVPTLLLGDHILTEASAIMLELARKFPDLALADPRNDKARFLFERTVIFLGGTLHPYFWPWFAPARYGASDSTAELRVRGAAEVLIAGALTQIDAQLGEGPFLLGERRTVADAYLFPMARWGYKLSRPTSQYANIERFMRIMMADNSVRRALEAEGLPPLF
jgi:glutathione S-transferase